MHPAALPMDRLLAECDQRRLRRGGPGGQHRNKVETAVELSHRPTGVAAQASERRSQAENHRAAVHRLRVRLALAVRAPVGGGPSEAWLRWSHAGRVAIGPAHEDFPTMLAEALDRCAANGWEAPAAAAALAVSTSQLVKLLAAEPAALAMVNSRRGELGLAPLR